MIILAEYGAALTLRFPVIKAGSQDFAGSSDWTPATGDTKISKDGGSVANTTNNPAAVSGTGSKLWSLALTSTEMQAAEIDIQIVDSTTKAVEDQALIIQTYGNASARHKVNLNDSVRAGLTALPNAAAEAAGGLFTRGSGTGQINQNANGQVDVNPVAWKGGTIPTPNVTGEPLVDVNHWRGTQPSTLNSGTVQSDVERWLNQTPATPNTNGVPVVDGREWLRTGTAQAGASGSVTLDASASATNDLYKGCVVAIISGTGAGQARLITAYNGTTKVASVTPAWMTNPSSSSVFAVLPDGMADVEAWLSSAPNALASGRVDAQVGAYASGQSPAELVLVTPANKLSVDGSNRAKVDLERWAGSTPNTLISGRVDANAGVIGDKTGYALTSADKADVADRVWDEALSAHLSAGSTGEALDAASSASIAGPGALTRTIGLTAAGNPIEGASIWLATDAGGSNVIAGPLTTTSMGEVTVLVDAGTYYVWAQKDGFQPVIGQSVSVS